ncbi:MAG: gamma carbonic anhydrase family protein, partial [Oscillospiraceae bacterium]|nr:gamma carbonic anhydrase family protein [Oscillospiraceae bacterium]
DPGHPLRIGNNVTIGHNAVIHCASVGDNTLVGMGARLLDGAVIGKNCIIGAGAVVKERDNVPDGTMMVGVPAKAVKALPPDYIAALEQQSTYVALSKEYME